MYWHPPPNAVREPRAAVASAIGLRRRFDALLKVLRQAGNAPTAHGER